MLNLLESGVAKIHPWFDASESVKLKRSTDHPFAFAH